GDIQVFSTPGTGTTVKIYLPAVSSDGKELTVVTPKTGPETILVLEDEPMVLRFLLRALERKKYRVVACSDIDEARVKFEEMGREIDLILTDVVLPKGSGPEFIRDLRSQVPGLKVLFMTGHTEHELVDPLAYEGGRGPLEKPILMEELFARVRESLDSSFE
ncbi:response regulator, partial [bacterium]|nr:response regulator [bacterium]